MCARAYVRVRVRMRMRARIRACTRVGVCAYMRGHGTVSGGGMRLSEVGSCLVIVAWCNCCMCNYMSMGVVAWALWFVVFLSCCRGFDTPRDASVSNGFKLSGLSGLTFPIGNTYDGANKTNEH